jgi:hypothetical protein
LGGIKSLFTFERRNGIFEMEGCLLFFPCGQQAVETLLERGKSLFIIIDFIELYLLRCSDTTAGRDTKGQADED